MRYKRYEKYKDSGVEYLGELPQSWQIKSIKHVIKTIQTGTTPSTQNKDYFDGELTWFTPGDFNGNKDIYESKRKISYLAIEEGEAKLFPQNTVMIIGIGDVGKVAKMGTKGSFNQQITGLICNESIINSDYLYYWLDANKDTIKKIANCNLLPIINNDFIKNLKIFYPNIEEQKRITNFLNKKTSEIDSLIQDKEKLISLLEEKRQAIITEAVTKGLNPNVKMKDSGIEWIGEIPEHWEVKPLKRIFKIVNGGTPNSSRESYWNGEIVWVTPNDLSKLTEVYIKNSERKITEDGLYNCSARIVSRGSIIISTRAPIGYVAIAGVDLCTNQGCKSLVAIKKANPKYFYYWIFSINFYLNALGQGTTFMELSNDNLSMVGLLIPPICEQEEIANFLDKKTSEIDSLINDIKQQIQKLKEYRQSLIFEAVTGKIDLRDITLQ